MNHTNDIEKLSQMNEICVVHLVRFNNDFELFDNFIKSYLHYSAGVEHRLLILFKGFENDENKNRYIQALKNIPHETFEVSDEGYDINAYMKVTHYLSGRYQYLCFLNSNSIILDTEWLLKLYNQIKLENVGLVGATGSWQSHKGSLSSLELIFTASTYCLTTIFDSKSFDYKLQKLKDAYKHLIYLLKFDSFPNSHIRTTAFMILAERMINHEGHLIKTKEDAYIFESGKKGLSKSILENNLKLLIVGRDAIGYEVTDWDKSNVYFCNEQSNLLVSDNVTRQYQQGLRTFRKNLSNLAWNQNAHSLENENWLVIANKNNYEDKIQRQKEQLTKINCGSENDVKNIVIFGAGILGKYFQTWVNKNTPNINIIGFVDTNITASKVIHSPQFIVDNALDYDLILISSNRFYEEIMDELKLMDVDMATVI